jgi:PAB-dependent poly(A)-specific ribonuclease subunit 2
MNEWAEVYSTYIPKSTRLTLLQINVVPDLSSLPQNGHCAITTVQFDTDEELIWTGNEQGRLCSYYGPALQKYTCFRAHRDAVREIHLTKKLVLSLSSTSLSARTRRGLVKWTIEYVLLRQCRKG